jgi:hypothetical protein
VERIRCEISDDGARTTIRCTDRRLVERALTKTFRCPPEVVTCNNMTGLQVVSDKPYGGDKPCLKSAIYGTGPRQRRLPSNHRLVEQGFTPSDILVLVPSLKTAHRVEITSASIRSGISSYQPMRDDTEGGLDRNLYLNSTILYFPRMQGWKRRPGPLFRQTMWLAQRGLRSHAAIMSP